MSVTSRVQEHLQTVDMKRINLPRMADHLGMSQSTLTRRLGSEGVTFLELLIAERKRRCAETVSQNPKVKLRTLAEICGYSDTQGMGRAFALWHGLSLTDWRQENNGIGG